MAEHSWNSYCNNPECDSNKPAGEKEGDPDEIQDNIALAQTYSSWFLFGHTCRSWQDLLDYFTVVQWPGFNYREQAFQTPAAMDALAKGHRYLQRARFSFAKSPRDGAFSIRWLSEAEKKNREQVRTLWKTLGN